MGKVSQLSCVLEGENGLWDGGWEEFCGLSWLGSGVEQKPCLSKEWPS